MKYLLALVTLVSSECYADTNDTLLHDTAHVGGTYVITHISEVVCTKVTSDKHKVACTVTGMILANAVNVAYKANEHFPSDTNRSIGAGLVGSSLAGIVINW